MFSFSSARKKNACDQVMQAVTGALDKSEFKHNNQSARILTGKEEGVFGWMTVNLLKKRIANKQVCSLFMQEQSLGCML